MYKRGQMFLIAAFVIVGVIVGLATVYNQSIIPKQEVTTYDLSSEISFESAQVINSGVLAKSPNLEVQDKLKSLAQYYSSKSDDKDYIVIYGDTDKVNYYVYKKVNQGTIGLNIGSTSTTDTITGTQEKFHSENYPPDNNVIVTLDGGVNYPFKLRDGQSFYLIVKKSGNNQQFIAGSETPSATCANGYLEQDEQCDDANDDSSDGCSVCIVDHGWNCEGKQPSFCWPSTCSTFKTYCETGAHSLCSGLSECLTSCGSVNTACTNVLSIAGGSTTACKTEAEVSSILAGCTRDLKACTDSTCYLKGLSTCKSTLGSCVSI